MPITSCLTPSTSIDWPTMSSRAPKAELPQLVRQDDERRTAGARLLATEPPAALGRHGERLEQLGIHASRA